MSPGLIAVGGYIGHPLGGLILNFGTDVRLKF